MSNIHRQDNTFVIEKDGMPYHVVEGMAEYAGLLTDYSENPNSYTEEYLPEPYIPTAQELAQAEIERLEALQTPRLYREAIAGGEYAIAKLAEIDAAIAVQRKIIQEATQVENITLAADTEGMV